MWFRLAPTDLVFAAIAPHELRSEAVIAAAPERVFSLFVDAKRMGEWVEDFVSCTWDPPLTRGVGAGREVAVRMLRARQRVLAWQPGERLALSAEAVTVPLVTRMLEDVRFDRLGPARTRVTWRALYAPSLAVLPVHAVLRRRFGRLLDRSLLALSRRAVEVQPRPEPQASAS